jgi:hypothetical protein
MKNKFYKTVFLLSVILFTTSFKHPIKLTASLIEYDLNSTSLKTECKIFIDDFEKSINKTLTKNINLSDLTKEDKTGIEDYFEKYFNITINGKILPLKFKTSEVLKEYNVITIKFIENKLKIKKGDKLLIENTLFFEEFGYMQSNRITVRIPPFVTEDNHEAVVNNYAIPYNF